MLQRIVLHVDFDYFYAQCEEIRDLSLKAKPVCVCVYSGRDQDSGAVATANYLARKYGAKSGMSIRLAKAKLQKSEDAVFLPTDFDYYSDISERAMKAIQEYADVFEYVGRDEAYLDVSARTGRSYEMAAHVAQQIKNAVWERIRLTCSVGVSPNRLVSKIASDFNKPDGLTVVTPDRVSEFLEPLKVRNIPGIGKKAEGTLAGMKITTVKQLRDLDIFDLNKRFGRKTGAYIYGAARGKNDEPVAEREPSVQFSRISTLKQDSKEFDFLHQSLLQMCQELHHTVQKNGRLFRSVGVQFVQSDMSGRTKSRMLRNPTSSLAELEKVATTLLREALEDQKKQIRRLGVRVSELSDAVGQIRMDSYF